MGSQGWPCSHREFTQGSGWLGPRRLESRLGRRRPALKSRIWLGGRGGESSLKCAPDCLRSQETPFPPPATRPASSPEKRAGRPCRSLNFGLRQSASFSDTSQVPVIPDSPAGQFLPANTHCHPHGKYLPWTARTRPGRFPERPRWPNRRARGWRGGGCGGAAVGAVGEREAHALPSPQQPPPDQPSWKYRGPQVLGAPGKPGLSRK